MSSLGNKEIMAHNIRRLMDSASVKPKDVCDTLKIPMPTFSDWINAKTYPRIDKIEMLANYFGVQKSDLVEEEAFAPEKEREISDDDIKFALFGGDGEITEAMYDEVRRFARMVKMREDAERKKE